MSPKIIRRVEAEGRWWAERADGTWTPWDPDKLRWGPAESPPAGVPLRLKSDGPAKLESVVPAPMNRADAWWNRNFPPNSGKRLAFFLAWSAFIIIALAFVRRLQGHPVPVVLTIGAVSTCWVFLGGTWLLSARTRKPGAPESVQITRSDATNVPLLVRDFLQSLPIAVVGMLIVLVVAVGWSDLSTASVLIAVGAGALFAATITLRHTIWFLVITSAIAGFLIAAALAVVDLMTFTVPHHFASTWVISSIAVLVFSVAVRWVAVRSGLERLSWRSRPRPPPLLADIPAWGLTALGIVPVALVALLAGLGDS